jgi:adenosylhomocysteine nucleosidase
MIGLVAVWGEATALLKSINVEMTTQHLQARFHRGHLAGRPVVLAEVGPGKIYTAAATQRLIDQYQVRLLVSCGSAGALSPALRVGDVILADRVTLHDFGLYTENNFQHLGFYDHTRPDGLHFHRALTTDATLLAVAQQAAYRVAWSKTPPKIETGCLTSGDQVIADDAKKQWLRDTFQAVAVDMESGAVAQVALLNGISWLAVRAVSDLADSTVDIGLMDFITYSDEPGSTQVRLRKTVHKVAAILQTPNRFKKALKFRQSIQHAAANAATVTRAIIAQLA